MDLKKKGEENYHLIYSWLIADTTRCGVYMLRNTRCFELPIVERGRREAGASTLNGDQHENATLASQVTLKSSRGSNDNR